MAITLDDLPYAGDSLEEAERATVALLAALAEHGVPAAAFVEGRRVEIDGEVGARRELLRRWREAGHTLENHSYEHLHYNRTPTEDYLADVQRGHAVVEALSEGRVRFFRPPYNQVGPTPEAKQALLDLLAKEALRLAPFTVEHADWMFSAVYEHELARGDYAAALQVGQAYLAQLDSAFTFAERVAGETFGRDIPHVLLIHANRINADYLDAMLAQLAARGYRFVSLETAVADSAFSTPDDYVGPWGISWLHRWRVGLGLPNLLKLEPEPPKSIAEAFEVLRRG